MQKEKWEKVSGELFYNHLQKKYSFLDVTQEKINSIGFWFKKQLLWAVSNINAEFKAHGVSKKIREEIMKKTDRILKSK
jgi:hypothetical protein